MQAEATGANVSLTLESGDPLLITADVHELEIILTNLLSNAIKYNHDGGRVTMRLARRGEQAVIAVSDTGIGMSPDEVPRLFHEFSRIKNERTSHILGSGLGLSIVKKLARALRR